MIIEEFLRGGKFVRHYSDSRKMILQVETGEEYSDAVDLMPCKYTYTETDKNIEESEWKTHEVKI